MQLICFIMNFIGARGPEFSLGPWPPSPPWNRPRVAKPLKLMTFLKPKR